jgi:hypothetical protein
MISEVTADVDLIPGVDGQRARSRPEADQLPELAQGEGLWRIGQRAFVVRHVCTPGELQLFDTNARMITKSDPRGFPGS